jgi:hypothetical protein
MNMVSNTEQNIVKKEPAPRLEQIPSTAENWENGTLGCDIRYAKQVSPEVEKQINDALGLEKVVLMLPKELVREYEVAAKSEGTISQKLMRDALSFFIKIPPLR